MQTFVRVSDIKDFPFHCFSSPKKVPMMLCGLARVDEAYKLKFKIFVDNCCSDLIAGTWIPPNLREEPAPKPNVCTVSQLPKTPPRHRQRVVVDQPMGVPAYQQPRHGVVSHQPYPGNSSGTVANMAENVATATPSADGDVIEVSPGRTYHQLQTVPYPHIPSNANNTMMYQGRRRGNMANPLEYASSP